MLGRRQHRIGVRQTPSLESPHTRLGKAASELDILARAFDDAAPSRIARHVDHGSIGPVEAVGGRLDRRDPRRRFGRRQVEARRFADRHWKDGAESVDHIVGKEQRNAETGFFDRDPLEAPGRFGAIDAQKRADPAGTDIGFASSWHEGARVVPLAARLSELAKLFVEGHAGQQRVHVGRCDARCGARTGARQDGSRDRARLQEIAAADAALHITPPSYFTASTAGRVPVSTQPRSASQAAADCSGLKPQCV